MVDSESSTNLSNGKITFTNLNQDIAAAAAQRYLLTVDVASSDSLDGCVFNIAIANDSDIDVEDDDSNDLTPNVDNTPSRNITVKGAGNLSVVEDVVDSKVSSNKHVIG